VPKLKQQIPTRVQLEELATEILDGLGADERQAWVNNRCTQALFVLLEAARMQAIELYENGATGEKLTQFMAQAQLARNLTEDLYKYIVDPPEAEATPEVPYAH